MWIDAVTKGLEDGHHAGPQVGLFHRRGHEIADGLPGEPSQDAPQLALPEEQGPQHLGNGEDPLRMGHVLEDVVGQKRRQLATALGGVRGAQLPLLTRKI